MTAYDGYAILCRKCVERDMDEKQLIAYLDSYAESLPDGIRADEITYRERLEKCAACVKRTQYTCQLCGCYVQARAAKKALGCPKVPDPEWKPVSPKETYEKGQFEL